MTQATSNVHSTPNYPQVHQDPRPSTKLFAETGGATESGNLHDLYAWAQNAQAWLQDFYAGKAEGTDQQAAQVQQWLQWAMGQLGYGGNGGTGFGSEFSGGYTPERAEDPFGAYPTADGAENSWFMNDKENRRGVLADGRTVYFWGEDQTVDVKFYSAKVIIEKTEIDGEEVYKVTYIDEARDKKEVHIFHDIDDPNFHLQLNLANVDSVEDHSGDLGTKITVDEYQAQSTESNPQVNIEGEPMEGEDGTYVEAPNIDTPIIFNPNDDSSEDEIWFFYGQSQINLPLSSEAVVTKSGRSDFPYMITITHQPSGKKDIVYVKDFDQLPTNIIGLDENITCDLDGDGVPDVDPGEVPPEIEDFITINKDVGEADGEVDGDYANDTDPYDSQGNVGHYGDQDNHDVNLTADFGENDEITDHIINIPGVFNLKVNSFTDTVVINKFTDGNGHDWYMITVKRPGETDEQFRVEGPPSNINIEGVTASQLEGSALGDPRITINGEEWGDDFAQAEWPDNPSEFISLVPQNGHNDSKAIDFAELVDLAMRGQGSWGEVKSFLDDIENDYGNDVVRKFLTALYQLAGSDMDKLDQFLDEIPEDVRRKMADELNTESDQKFEGEQWTTRITKSIIEGSINN